MNETALAIAPPPGEKLLDRTSGFLLFAFTCFCMSAYGLHATASHDESQYIVASHLWPELAFYRDFIYSQTPYFAIGLSWWSDLIPVNSPYMAGRYFNLVWTLLFYTGLWIGCVYLARSWFLGAVAVFAVSGSVMISLAQSVLRNDMMGLAWGTLAALCLLYLSRPRDAGWGACVAFLCGLCIAIAAGTKQSYFFLFPVAAAFLLLQPPEFRVTRRIGLLIVPLGLGGLAGALPTLVFASESWSNFVFSVAEFHATSHPVSAARGLGAQPKHAEWGWTVIRSAKFIIGGTTLFLLLVFLCGLALRVAIAGWRSLAGPDDREGSGLLLAILGLAFALPLCLMPRPQHPQYLAGLLPFLALGFAAGAAELRGVMFAVGQRGVRLFQVGTVAVCAGILAVALWNPVDMWPTYKGAYFRMLRLAEAPGEFWADRRMARIRESLRAPLCEEDREVRVATVLNVYAIDAGFNIFPELAAAPFFFRVNDIYPAERLRVLNGLAPEEVYDWLEANDVKAILTRSQIASEKQFADYAEDHGFEAVEIDLSDHQGAHVSNSKVIFFLAPGQGALGCQASERQ
jgi:hypothetical protein